MQRKWEQKCLPVEVRGRCDWKRERGKKNRENSTYREGRLQQLLPFHLLLSPQKTFGLLKPSGIIVVPPRALQRFEDPSTECLDHT